MGPVKVIGIAVGLGMDAMSVCMAVGVRWHGGRQKFRLAWHMGLFQFLMPILGYLAGRQLAGVLRRAGAYLAAALVVAIGVKMLYEAIGSRPGSVARRAALTARRRRDPTRGFSLVVLSLATSIDALVAGVSLGLRGEEIFWTSAVIGVTAALMALTGVVLGKRLGQALGTFAEIMGGVILIGLGVSFVWF